MNRPFRTDILGNAWTRHCVPGFYEWSRWDRRPITYHSPADHRFESEFREHADGHGDIFGGRFRHVAASVFLAEFGIFVAGDVVIGKQADQFFRAGQ